MPASQPAPRSYPRWRELLADARLPAAIVDLDAVDANLALIGSHLGRTTLRPATKSLRIPALLSHISAALGDRLSGWMLYSAAEAELLAGHPETAALDDLLIAYPVGTRHDAARLVNLARRGKTLRVVIDAPDHVALLADASAGNTPPSLSVILDIDAAWRPLAPLFPGRGGPHLGVRRSPLRTADAALQLARAAERAGLRVSGLMAYEAQVAGIPDRSPGSRHLDPFRRLIRSASAPDIAARRAAIVRALRETGVALEIVNGGGSGSLLTTPHDPSVTEVTAGSGVLGPHAFDGYRGLPFSPAAFFALPVTRIPDPGHVTCAFGGFIASGAPPGTRAPTVHLPTGLSPLDAEGFGEVQTPLRRDPRVAPSLAVGDPVICRHAKAGELFEHFNEALLVRGDAIVGRASTYRGLGLAAG
jgi:D-serine deaminase-like pyridoxal phosphate-dependent protein